MQGGNLANYGEFGRVTIFVIMTCLVVSSFLCVRSVGSGKMDPFPTLMMMISTNNIAPYKVKNSIKQLTKRIRFYLDSALVCSIPSTEILNAVCYIGNKFILSSLQKMYLTVVCITVGQQTVRQNSVKILSHIGQSVPIQEKLPHAAASVSYDRGQRTITWASIQAHTFIKKSPFQFLAQAILLTFDYNDINS